MKTVTAKNSINTASKTFLPAVRGGFLAAATASLLLGLLAPGMASAASVCTACVSIDDLTDLISATTNNIPGATIDIVQEDIGVLGAVDIRFEYFSTSPNVPAPGVNVPNNFNIFHQEDPTGAKTLSDTLHVVISGRPVTGTNPNNVVVNIQFRSDSLDGIAPAGLSNAINILENGEYQTVHAGLGDLDISYRSEASAVPLPAAAWLFGSGLLGLIGVAQRKARTA